jgi:putative methyltransferase (TIGR01177 family)
VYIRIRIGQEGEAQALTMASHVASLRGWHPALARAEVSALLPHAQLIRLASRRLVRLEGDLSLSQMQEAVDCASGCQALLFDAIVWDSEEDTSNFIEQMRTYLETYPRSGSVAVRPMKHEGKMAGVSSRDLARKIGGILSLQGYSIDLEAPTHRLGMVLDASAGVIACGWMVGSGDDSEGITSRRATDRPFFKPVSLDPRLARLAVNVASGPREKGATLDLMTGTGGFVLEAALSGRETYGVDLDPLMIEGAQQNLDWAMPASKAQLLLGDATRLPHVLPLDAHHRICGFVLDPPYGRNSQGSLDHAELIQSVLQSARKVAASAADLVLILPIHPFGELPDEALESNASVELLHGEWDDIQSTFTATGWRINQRWVEHVHASLGRLILHATIVPQD